MIIKDFIKEDIKGDTVHHTQYRHLYHMTTNHGFAYTVDNDALRTKNYWYVSTTYDPNMDSYVGGDHAHFKFILNGPKLAETYGCFTYDAHATVVGSRRERVSLNEREIGINTKSIEPFREFVEGLILLFDPFSRTAVQWMFYDNSENRGLFHDESAAPRAMEMMIKFRDEWKLPIYIGQHGRMMNERELRIFRDFEDLHNQGADFDEAFREIADRHNIKDFFGRPLDKKTVIRLQKADQITDLLNDYFTKVKVKDINEEYTRKLISHIFDLLGLGHNQKHALLAAADQYDFFNKLVAPVNWAIVIRDAMYGEIDDATEYMKRWRRENEWHIKRINDDPDQWHYMSNHVGTRLA